MKTTMTLAANLSCTPFDLYKQDCDEVIMTINFYIALSDVKTELPKSGKAQTLNRRGKQKRIRVNDATATGGWF